MQVYPAIDIKGGRVVRTTDGGPGTTYGLDPVVAAERFIADGACWLHVVDLDRAFHTGRDNDALVRRIAGLEGARVQVGGLLNGPDQVARALELGAARAVVATAAAADPQLWEAIAVVVDPSRLAVAVDLRQGRVVRRDSPEPLGVAPDELVRRAVAAGVHAVVHRDLARDGELAGADVEGAAGLIGLGADIFVAGGIASAAHLVAARDARLAGAIVGRALYEGRLTLREALACSA